jgi:hypothetical protein
VHHKEGRERKRCWKRVQNYSCAMNLVNNP